jgi:hypothetical protein
MPVARLVPWLVTALLLPPSRAEAQWQGALGLEERMYFSAPPRTGDGQQEPLLAANVGRDWRWRGGAERLVANVALRADMAGDREVLPDLHQLELDVARDRWTLRAGVSQVSWGVLESRRLVDVINQRAPDPHAPGNLKLGQLMVNLTARGSWGAVDLYLLPWFRARPLTGRAARLWSPDMITTDDAQRASASGIRLADWAVRGTRTIGPWDVGLSFFLGTDREPTFELVGGDTAAAVLAPRYDRVHRLSADVQWTRGSWLGKLEAVASDGAAGRYVAGGTGVEYAPRDYVSLYGEILFDSRGVAATTSWEHDLFVGTRLLYRDGTVNLRSSVDPTSGNVIFGLEATRRLSNSLVLTLETRAFLGDAAREPPRAWRTDTSVALGVTRYF